MKNIRILNLKILVVKFPIYLNRLKILVVKFPIYLNRLVFAMYTLFYQEDTTITKHNLPEAPKEEEMRNEQNKTVHLQYTL